MTDESKPNLIVFPGGNLPKDSDLPSNEWAIELLQTCLDRLRKVPKDESEVVTGIAVLACFLDGAVATEYNGSWALPLVSAAEILKNRIVEKP